jgi:hypothetical protein
MDVLTPNACADQWLDGFKKDSRKGLVAIDRSTYMGTAAAAGVQEAPWMAQRSYSPAVAAEKRYW